MGASTGNFSTVRSQLSLRQTFLFTKSYVLPEPEVYVFRAGDRFDAAGNLQDEQTRSLIRQLIERLVRWTRELQATGEAPRVGLS
jgi:chromate reductase, NAD(P)H dehydrogenase (quinone)